MLYEVRSYDIEPTMLDDYVVWASEKALPLLRGHFGFDVVGFWRKTGAPPEVQEPSPTNIVWIVRWKSEEQRNQSWQRVRESKEWKAIREGTPSYWNKTDSSFMIPIPGSPMQ